MHALTVSFTSLPYLSARSVLDVFVKRRNVFTVEMVGAAGKSSSVKAKKPSRKNPSTQELLAWPTVSRKSSLRRDLLHSTNLFTVASFLNSNECQAFVRCVEARGLEHQGSGGPAKGEAFRDNDRLADHNVELADMLWHAGLRELFQDIALGSRVAVGLNPNIRLYRYVQGQRFGPHYDESVDMDGGGETEFTLLVYLTGDLNGGETVFYDRRKVVAEVAPVAGMALFHVHGARCLLHEAKSVLKGVKFKKIHERLLTWMPREGLFAISHLVMERNAIILDMLKNSPTEKRLEANIKASFTEFSRPFKEDRPDDSRHPFDLLCRREYDTYGQSSFDEHPRGATVIKCEFIFASLTRSM